MTGEELHLTGKEFHLTGEEFYMRRWTMAAVVAALGIACAGAPPITPDRVSPVESEIRAAQEIGADNNPQGKLHLQKARDSLEAAKGLKDTPEYALRKLEQAAPAT